MDLEVIDKVKPNLSIHYTIGATVEGAAAGFMISGGEILATGGSLVGADVGGAPGIGMVVGVMAGDAVAVLVAANRAVAHTASYYGYNVNQPDERMYALAVLGMGTAAGAGKAAAYMEINKLVQMLARRATWDVLRQQTITRAIEKVFVRLSVRITQRKLAQAVPVVDIALGAGMNAHMLTRVTDDAEHIYRERFLRERYGLSVSEPVTLTPEQAEDGDVIDTAHILDDEMNQRDGPVPI